MLGISAEVEFFVQCELEVCSPVFPVRRWKGCMAPDEKQGIASCELKIRSRSLAAQAEIPIVDGIGFPALRTEGNFSLVFLRDEVGLKVHMPKPKNILSGITDFFEKLFGILFLLGFQFQKPVPNLLPGFHFLGIQKDPHSFPVVLVI